MTTKKINNNFDDLSILILSCDKYSDLWPYFAFFFDKYWLDCPCPIYLFSNEKDFKHQNIKNIKTGKFIDWSTNLLKGLEQVKTKNVLILLEDELLDKTINNKEFQKTYVNLKNNCFNHCQIKSNVDYPRDSIIKNNLGIINKGMPYSANVIGFWNKDFLEKTLIAGESPWNFEIMGSYRVSYSDGIYFLPDSFYHAINGVGKGEWFSEAVTFCEKHGLIIDETKRKIKRGNSQLKQSFQDTVFSLVRSINWRKRVRLMNTLRKLFVSY
ncbi:MAG: hypothetical protein Q4G02_00940 [bacterium]|nr:hypothetical protein [bacterium]